MQYFMAHSPVASILKQYAKVGLLIGKSKRHTSAWIKDNSKTAALPLEICGRMAVLDVFLIYAMTANLLSRSVSIRALRSFQRVSPPKA